MSEKILIVEDEDTLRESLCRVFEREGYEVVAVNSAEPALELFDEGSFDLVITDIILPGITGIELIKRMREAAPEQPAIVMTAYASLETAVETLRAGAYDYIVKPIIHEEMKQTVRNALRVRALQEENVLLKEQVADEYDTKHIIGSHPDILDVKERLKKIAEARSPILITGEVGTGKKLIARAIHQAGFQTQRPFFELHCEALSPPEQEDALFGSLYRSPSPGSPKGQSVFRKARNGSVYLNRVEALSPESQKRLLHMLEERQVSRPEGVSLPLDALLIAGSDKDIESSVAEGRFLEELYQRLKVIRVHLPPLRDRKVDIEPLTRFFLDRYRYSLGNPVKDLAPDTRQMLEGYSWPGNVLELRNLLERAVLLTKNEHLQPADFPPLSRSC